MSTVLPYRSRAKQVKFGLEVPNGLTYQGWEPGGEYTKSLTLKNVHLKTQKIRYKISSSRFSSGIYPQPVVLSAGTSYTLPITFRPSEKCPYEEFIQIETGEGEFKVPIKAQLPRPDIALPDSLRFGMCAIQESVTVNFEISNIGNIPADFCWEMPDGFKIIPQSGSLSPKQSSKLTARFSPQSAIVHNGLATCTFSSSKEDHDRSVLILVGDSQVKTEIQRGTRKVMKLEGIGKYPHVAVKLCSSKLQETRKRSQESKLKGSRKSGKVKFVTPTNETTSAAPCDSVNSEDLKSESGKDVTVDFGCVAVGTVAERWIEITNVSPVSLTFDLTPPPSGTSESTPLFTCAEFEGVLQPHGSRKIKLLYAPGLVTSHPSVGYFTVKALGGLGGCTVTCNGTPVGPQVQIEEAVLNFGNVEAGKTVTRVMHIKNSSDVRTTFQFQLDSGSVFQCTTSSGELGPLSSQTIVVQFAPQHSIPYCRRVTCLVQHQDPLFIYFIGTCFSETVRPACLQPKHLCTYLEHAKTGLSKLPPEQLKKYLEQGQLSMEGQDGALVSTSPDLPLPPHVTPLTPHTSTYAHYLQSENEPSAIAHVSADVEVVKFGYCPPQRTSDSKLVSITNHTMGTVCCVWMTGTTSASDSFTVLPAEREIQSGMTASFTLNFNPEVPSQFYSKEIECFVFYKGLQDYRNINPHTITPPWCTTVRVSGHTFAPGTETYQPRLTFDTKNLVFPPSVPGQPVYRTALLKNVGDTPILFDITQDPTQPFLVKPSHGLLRVGHQLLALQMLPSETKVYKHIMSCRLNASELLNEELLLSGSGEAPSINLDNEGELFFKPTCIGTRSSLPYSITNSSRLPVRFEWRVDPPGHSVIKVQPKSGTILPNETQTHTWYFTPLSCKQYALKATLVSSIPIGHPGDLEKPISISSARKKSLVNIHGLGTSGTIKCTPTCVDSGTVIIGTSCQHNLTLYNPSPCSLHYRLSVVCGVSGKDGYCADSSFYNGILELSPTEGVLPACSEEPVKLIVRPSTSNHYNCTIKYQLISNTSNKNTCNKPITDGTTHDTSSETFDLCTLTVSGAYPSLTVVDVQGEDVANLHSKASLWNMLNVDKVNSHLHDEPSSSELRYAIATRHSMRRRVPVRTRAIVDFDFGAAPLNTGNSVVNMMLENKGEVPTDWAFQFPSDMHLEPEYWAESGQMDDIERHELNIVDNELFTVRPKGGTLEPGQITTVTACFKHTHIGTSKLPVLLKINRGREILLNWSGVTVEPGHPYVHFTSQYHSFSPVPIGTQAYPRQVYTLHNIGESPVSYEFDTRPLEALKQRNYLMSVFECLHPKGVIPARASVPVQFVFSPLEAKRYTVDLPVHLSSGETVFVSFSGEGYDLQGVTDDHKDDVSSMNTQNIPVHNRITIPGQLTQLSQQSIGFGHLPLFSAVRRLVFVTNPSQHTLSYHWDLGSELAQEVLSVQPVHGYIQPGESTACKITLCSHTSPSFYNLDLLCQDNEQIEQKPYLYTALHVFSTNLKKMTDNFKVVDESEMLVYESELREWERKEEEKKHHFTITESCDAGDKHSPVKATKRPQSMPKLKAVPTKKSSGIKSPRPLTSDSDLRGKLSALPPIGVSEETYEEWKKKDLSVKKKTRPRAKQTSENKPPTPPQPLVLHLGVSAQTSSMPDYAAFNSDLNTFYIDKQSLVTGSDREREEKLKVGIEEKEVLGNVLNQMIRELLEDDNFHSAVKHVVEEPIPYFTQFSSHVGPSKSVQQSAHRHMYATGLRDMPSRYDSASRPAPSHHLHPHSHSSLSHDSGEVHEVTPQRVESEVEVGDGLGEKHLETRHLEEADHTNLESKIKLLPEFTSLVEGVLENTVLNILKEASSGEMNITKPIYTITKVPEIEI